MNNTIEIHIGDTLSYGGVVTLPAGAWTGVCSFASANPVHHDTNITVNLTLIGANSVDPARGDWAVSLHASSVETLGWPKPLRGGAPLRVQAAIKFEDDQVPPNVKTSSSFAISISAQVVP
jgi:hypothetical protein